MRDIWHRKRIMDMENVVISKKGNIAAVFNEWARRFAENPGDFCPVVGDDGKLISDYGERCEAYFLRVFQELGNGASAMNADTVVISKAEYADLLRHKAAALDGGAKAEEIPPFVKDPHPGKQMSTPDRKEIERLHKLGYRPREIGEVVGRSGSTISAYIAAHLKARF